MAHCKDSYSNESKENCFNNSCRVICHADAGDDGDDVIRDNDLPWAKGGCSLTPMKYQYGRKQNCVYIYIFFLEYIFSTVNPSIFHGPYANYFTVNPSLYYGPYTNYSTVNPISLPCCTALHLADLILLVLFKY